MAGAKKFDRRGSGPLFWVLLVLIIFALYSGTVAALTADDCPAGSNASWQVFPPAWDCSPQLPGYG